MQSQDPGIVVDDFDQAIAELRARGLALQDYDLPHSNVLGLFEQPFLTRRF